MSEPKYNLTRSFGLLVAEVESATGNLSFDSSKKHELAAISLFASVLEFASATHLLLLQEKGSVVPLLLRAAFDAYIDLANLSASSEYLATMTAIGEKERIKQLKAARDRGADSPYLSDLASRTDLTELIEQAEGNLRKLKEQGNPPLTAFERAELAGVEILQQYDGVYRMMSQRVHGTIVALEERHLLQTENGVQVVIYRPLSLDEVVRYADTLAHVLANSYHFATLVLGNGAEADSRITEQLKRFRSYLPQDDN